MNVIECARLSLRELVLEDARFILRLLNEPGFLRFEGRIRLVKDGPELNLFGPPNN